MTSDALAHNSHMCVCVFAHITRELENFRLTKDKARHKLNEFRAIIYIVYRFYFRKKRKERERESQTEKKTNCFQWKENTTQKYIKKHPIII